jgi:drug/metabolite transporter (DMT)-like permease
MTNAGVMRCLIAAVLFGATAPAASELAGTVPAFTLAGLLYLGAALAVTPSNLRRPPDRSALAAEWRPVVLAVVFGGAVGPVLLVAGLARTSAASASILLNTELVATVVLAALLFREHIGRRVAVSAALVTTAGAVLTWDAGAGVDVGAVLIVAACACWGLDNCVTARIEQLAPEHVVALKGAVAGGTNLAIGVLTAGVGVDTGLVEVSSALLIGAAGYGLSIVLWVKGARDLGAARAQVIFATAPFAGAVIAWSVLREQVTGAQLIAVGLAAVGVGVSLRSAHQHPHHHHEVDHDHEHTHDSATPDEHHDHVHGDGFAGRHSHAHHHGELVHAHPHVPDLHHRHDH